MGLIIFVVIVGIFIGYRRVSNENENKTEIFPDSDNASVSLKRIHQTASKNGAKEWSLDAESAQYFKTRNRIVFKNPSVVFFLKNGSDIKLSAKQGCQHRERDQHLRICLNPLSCRRQPAGGHDEMQMQVLAQFVGPALKHGGHAGHCAKPARIRQ